MSGLGPRAMAVLTIAGVAGLAFGILGWTQRGTGLVTPLVSASPSAASPSAASPRAAAAAPADEGPELSSEPFASFAYRVWPGPVSADARLAMSGFVLTVSRQGSGIAVNAVHDGTKMTGASHFYPGGATVYVLDSNLGDEGGSVDYNTTDDGLIVTNARGQVLG